MKVERVDGNLYRAIGPDGKTRFQYRRLIPVFDNGKRKYQDIKRELGTSLIKASVEASNIDAEVDAQLKGERPREDVTVGAFVARYLERIRATRGFLTFRSSIQGLLQALGPRPLTSVKRIDIEELLARRRETKRPATVAGTLRVVRRLFNVALENGLVTVNPTQGIRMPRVPRTEFRLPTPDEVRRLLTQIQRQRPWMYPICVTLLFTGGRLGEILSLDWSQMDLASGQLRLVRTKVDDIHAIPIARQLKAVLWEHWMKAGMPKQGPVFLSQMGRPYTTRRVYLGFRPVAERLEMPWFTLKTFRRRAATSARLSPLGMRAAQMLLGHTEESTTSLYLGDTDLAKQSAVEAVEQWVGHLPEPIMERPAVVAPEGAVAETMPQDLVPEKLEESWK